MAIDPIMLALMRKGGGGGSGVQADYAQNDPNAADYIKNRPGGYYDGWEITWDGEIGDRLVVENGEGEQMVKVSDRVIAYEELTGCTVVGKRAADGEKLIYVLTNGDIFANSKVGVIVIMGGVALVVFTKSDQSPFPETGIYFKKTPEDYIQSISKKSPIKIPAELTTMDGGYVKSTVLFDGVITSDKLVASEPS